MHNGCLWQIVLKHLKSFHSPREESCKISWACTRVILDSDLSSLRNITRCAHISLSCLSAWHLRLSSCGRDIYKAGDHSAWPLTLPHDPGLEAAWGSSRWPAQLPKTPQSLFFCLFIAPMGKRDKEASQTEPCWQTTSAFNGPGPGLLAHH